jgi:Phage-related protein
MPSLPSGVAASPLYTTIYILTEAYKPLRWVGSSLNDLRTFPEDARRRIGYQLWRVS